MNSKNKKRVLLTKPFVHENLEFKNALLEYARELKKNPKDNFESQLISAVLYAQLAEYMASFLLESLRHLVYDITYSFSQAFAFIDTRNRLGISLDRIIEGLKEFSFSDKPDILSLLIEVKNARNDLFHNLVSKSQEDLIEIGEDIITIQEKTEVIIQKLNIVTPGLQNVFYPANLNNNQPEADKTK
jgi:hypothetical protein